MNYKNLDLNLLHVFNTVMMELNVTRSAERLHMTQPAVSNAIKRLRQLLNDELFVKVPSGVRPTPKATQIWHPIRDALTQIRQTLEPAEFNPAIAALTFTVAMNDFSANLLLPKLIVVLETLAPSINIHTIPSTNINATMLLEQAEIDLAIGVFATTIPQMRSHSLLESPFTCVMRQGHALAHQPLTLEKYVQAKHLLVTLTGEATGFIDLLLQEQGLKRRVVLTVNQFVVAPRILANSDLIAVLPTRIAEMGDFTNQLCCLSLPMEISPSVLKMMWHERNNLDPAQMWLRTQFLVVCECL